MEVEGDVPQEESVVIQSLKRKVIWAESEAMAAALRWRSDFPRIAGPLVLSSGCWVHDGFQMLSGLSDAPDYGTV